MSYQKLLPIIIFVLSIVSCKTNYRISVDQPPTIKIPKEAKLMEMSKLLKEQLTVY
ncbi:MAG: hypothetical protein HRT57_15330 [Crocinitomicaceae bacterium]|nr:hypothetical protein [Crocinitomicaceae bacterium]